MELGELDLFILSQVNKCPLGKIKDTINRYNSLLKELPELESKTKKAVEEYQKISKPLEITKCIIDSLETKKTTLNQEIELLKYEKSGLSDDIKQRENLLKSTTKQLIIEENKLSNTKKEIERVEKEIKSRLQVEEDKKVKLYKTIDSDLVNLKDKKDKFDKDITAKNKEIDDKIKRDSKILHANLILERELRRLNAITR